MREVEKVARRRLVFRPVSLSSICRETSVSVTVFPCRSLGLVFD
jgi:hypothetical protein